MVRPGDTVWVHDYHLMLLPSMLKSTMPSLKVGWFLHTPFPTSEVFRMLPMRDVSTATPMKGRTAHTWAASASAQTWRVLRPFWAAPQ